MSPWPSCRGKDAFVDQPFAQFDAVIVVDVEQGDGDAADRSAADQICPLPAKMPCPLVTARVKQTCKLTRLLISPADIRTFELVAAEATEGEVAGDGRPLVFPGDDVVDLERSFVELLGQLAIFAAAMCPLPYLPDERRFHAGSGGDAFLGFDAKRAARLGFEDGKQVAGLAEGEQLLLLGGSQGIVLIAHGQVVHAGLVPLAESQIQDVTGELDGKLSAFVAQDAREDGDLVFAGLSRGCIHMRSFAVYI